MSQAFIPRKMLLAQILDPLRWSIGGPHAHRGEHVFGRPRQDIRNVPLARPTPAGKPARGWWMASTGRVRA